MAVITTLFCTLGLGSTVLFQFDSYIIKKLQEIYLWAYDWTGIYVASVSAIAIIVGIAAQFNWMTFGLSIINIVLVVPRYMWQDSQKYALYNAIAMQVQESVFRVVAFYFFIVVFIAEIVASLLGVYPPLNCINTFGLWLYINMSAVCIREREPKEWFKRQHLATETSS